MNRLTKEDLMNPINHTFCSGIRLVGQKMFAQMIDELCEYKTIEEELGIELTVLFSALKNGVYYFDEQGQLIRDYVSLVNNYIGVGTPEKLSFSFLTYSTRQTLLFENYGKTWSVNKKVLIKEELENE